MPMTFTRRRPTSCARIWSMFRPATCRDSDDRPHCPAGELPFFSPIQPDQAVRDRGHLPRDAVHGQPVGHAAALTNLRQVLQQVLNAPDHVHALAPGQVLDGRVGLGHVGKDHHGDDVGVVGCARTILDVVVQVQRTQPRLVQRAGPDGLETRSRSSDATRRRSADVAAALHLQGETPQALDPHGISPARCARNRAATRNRQSPGGSMPSPGLRKLCRSARRFGISDGSCGNSLGYVLIVQRLSSSAKQTVVDWVAVSPCWPRLGTSPLMLRPVAEPPRTFTGAQGSPAGRTPWRGLTSPRPSSIVGFATVVAHTAQRCPDDTSSSVGRHSCLLAGLVSGAGDCRKKPIQRTARGFQMQFRTPLLFASGGFFRQAVPALPDVVFSGGPAGTPFPCFPSHHRCPRPSRATLGGRDSAA